MDIYVTTAVARSVSATAARPTAASVWSARRTSHARQRAVLGGLGHRLAGRNASCRPDLIRIRGRVRPRRCSGLRIFSRHGGLRAGFDSRLGWPRNWLIRPARQRRQRQCRSTAIDTVAKTRVTVRGQCFVRTENKGQQPCHDRDPQNRTQPHSRPPLTKAARIPPAQLQPASTPQQSKRPHWRDGN
jgi:hypothetical protein